MRIPLPLLSVVLALSGVTVLHSLKFLHSLMSWSWCLGRLKETISRRYIVYNTFLVENKNIVETTVYTTGHKIGWWRNNYAKAISSGGKCIRINQLWLFELWISGIYWSAPPTLSVQLLSLLDSIGWCGLYRQWLYSMDICTCGGLDSWKDYLLVITSQQRRSDNLALHDSIVFIPANMTGPVVDIWLVVISAELAIGSYRLTLLPLRLVHSQHDDVIKAIRIRFPSTINHLHNNQISSWSHNYAAVFLPSGLLLPLP